MVQAGAAPPRKASLSFPAAVTVTCSKVYWENPPKLRTTFPFHKTSTWAFASSSGELKELDWKRLIVYDLPLIVGSALLCAIVPGRLSTLFALPKRATAFPDRAKGWKKKIVASSVPPVELVPIHALSELVMQKSAQELKPSNPPSTTRFVRLKPRDWVT